MNRTHIRRFFSLLMAVVLLSAAMIVDSVVIAIEDERPPPNGANSFTADTMVAVPDGERSISEIVVGDMVLGLNPETKDVEAFKVIDTTSHVQEDLIELTIDGEVLQTTRQHLFFTARGSWSEAQQLTVSDRIQAMDGTFGTVDSIVVVKDANQPVYSLLVQKAYTFFVGNGTWLVGS